MSERCTCQGLALAQSSCRDIWLIRFLKFGGQPLRVRLPRRGIPLSASATLILLASVIAGTSVFAQVKVGSANAKKKNRVTRVVVDSVRSEPMRQTIPVLGRFVARRTGPVAARAAGACAARR